MEDEEAQFIHDYAKENDVELHVHAPYYINLAGSGEELDLSLEKVIYSARIGDKMGAKTVVVHPGYYGEETEKKTMKKMVKSLKKIQGAFKKEKLKIKLGIETMGKKRVFGTLDEIIEICNQVKGVIPVIGLGHIHARTNGGLKKREDFEEVFAKLKSLRLKHYLLHVTGVMYEDGNEYFHVPIKKGDMPLAPLIEIIFDNNINVTFISESPLLEHDAVYIRLQVEKAIMKRTGKEEADYRDLSEIL
jgi:deoxyribonuclease-4